MKQCKVFVPYGALGTGISEPAFETGLTMKPDAIVCDAGSTDSGPYFLGKGECKYTKENLKEDMARMICGAKRLRVPVMIGSAGTCGTDAGVDELKGICIELCKEYNYPAKIACIYTELKAETCVQLYQSGRVHALEGAPRIDENTFRICSHIVGLAGAEPFIQALADGADIVLCGRATDTAIISALPLMRGCAVGACWHGAKIAECGSLCTTNSKDGGVFVTFDEEGFTVEPCAPEGRCTPYSVSAHMLYENADPYHLREPSGLLDATNAVYIPLDDRRVRVVGSRFTSLPYTIKLEGSGVTGYQTTSFVGIKDPRIMRSPYAWLKRMQTYVIHKLCIQGVEKDSYELDFKLYGYDAVTGRSPREGYVPEEIGLMLTVTGVTQAIATRVAKTFNPFLLHFPVDENEQLPTFAFPASPAETERGELYEFMLLHVVSVNEPMELFRYTTEVIS